MCRYTWGTSVEEGEGGGEEEGGGKTERKRLGGAIWVAGWAGGRCSRRRCSRRDLLGEGAQEPPAQQNPTYTVGDPAGSCCGVADGVRWDGTAFAGFPKFW